MPPTACIVGIYYLGTSEPFPGPGAACAFVFIIVTLSRVIFFFFFFFALLARSIVASRRPIGHGTRKRVISTVCVQRWAGRETGQTDHAASCLSQLDRLVDCISARPDITSVSGLTSRMRLSSRCCSAY